MSKIYVYILGLEGANYVKVGISRSPGARVTSIQTGNPFTVYLDAVFGPFDKNVADRVEEISHRILSDVSARGEWFMTGLLTARAIVQRAIDIEKDPKWESLTEAANHNFLNWLMDGAA